MSTHFIAVLPACFFLAMLGLSAVFGSGDSTEQDTSATQNIPILDTSLVPDQMGVEPDVRVVPTVATAGR